MGAQNAVQASSMAERRNCIPCLGTPLLRLTCGTHLDDAMVFQIKTAPCSKASKNVSANATSESAIPRKTLAFRVSSTRPTSSAMANLAGKKKKETHDTLKAKSSFHGQTHQLLWHDMEAGYSGKVDLGWLLLAMLGRVDMAASMSAPLLQRR
ncbi:hypothetical protein LTS10_012045 [Elasticomyces elasticus]|nr:hypothetical protein LTS10_012045 [Elasticomyces elasticus]